MALTLFYDALTRSGAIADVTADEVLTKKVFPDGSLEHWTHFVHLPSILLRKDQKIFAYNRYTRGGAVGILEETELNLQKRFAAGSFNPWTHITALGSLLFFYDQHSGTGAFAETEPKTIHLVNVNNPVSAFDLAGVKLDNQLNPLTPISKVAKIGPETETDCVTVRSFAPGSFSTWTHVVSVGLNLFFYHQDTGAGSLQRVRRKPPVTAQDLVLGGEVEMNTVKDFTKGSLGFWTHVVGAAPYLLFYNKNNRAGKIVRINEEGFSLVKDFGPNSFSPWTHIISGTTLVSTESTGKQGGIQHPIEVLGKEQGVIGPLQTFLRNDGASILFYDRQAGIGAMSKITANTYTSGKVYNKPGAFGVWSSISDSSADASPYDLGIQLILTQGSIEIRSVDGDKTNVSVSDQQLTKEDRDSLIDQVTVWTKDFIKDNTEKIKNGEIKAADIGGAVFGFVGGAIFQKVLILPFKVPEFIKSLAKVTPAAGATQVGRYYGAAVDDLISLLKGENDKASLIKVIAVLKTMNIVATQLHVIGLFGTNGWDLTKKVGEMLGGTIEEGLKTIANTVGDVFETGAEFAEDAAKFVKNILGF